MDGGSFLLSTMKVPFKFRMALLTCVLLTNGAHFAALAAQDRMTQDLAIYQHAPDPVHKSRALIRLGDEQVELAKKQLKEDEVASLHTLELYRDEVRETVVALSGMGVDAERKPAGFKELQISLRETIRHIDDMILT